MTETLNMCQKNGYKDRKEYFESLSDEYDCPIDIIYLMADVLGEDEDFDGLVSSLRDWEEGGMII
ncbi:MAG TPA: hypothetical protein VFC96_03995 [Anaerovoracaceae bacterium]|nr:hypothetical protein [Anaerovoracaceae bacterium]